MSTAYKNVRLDLNEDHFALVENLRSALYQANAFGEYFANDEPGGAFGAIKKAYIQSLTNAIMRSQIIFGADAYEIAYRLYDEMIDNGENTKYQVDLWNEGSIGLWSHQYTNDRKISTEQELY